MEVYAPRAAVYEVLPDFLLRLGAPGPIKRSPSTPVWVRFSDGTGLYEARRSTVGARYDFDRIEAEVGATATWAGTFDTWFAARYVTASASVSAETGGGAIEATGIGPSLGFHWNGASNFLAGAGYSFTAYDIDLSSNKRGLLKAGAGGYGHSLHAEVGRHIGLGGTASLTPRVWAVGSRVSMDHFTDAVNARVSFPETDRLTGGVGLVLETAHAFDNGSFFSFHGSVDFERMFDGARIAVEVSGDRLGLEAVEDSVLVGLSTVYRHGWLRLGAEAWFREVLESRSQGYGGRIRLGVHF